MTKEDEDSRCSEISFTLLGTSTRFRVGERINYGSPAVGSLGFRGFRLKRQKFSDEGFTHKKLTLQKGHEWECS